MATKVQKAHRVLLLKALAGRALKKLAPLYSDLSGALEALQFEVQDHEQTAVVAALRFIKTMDAVVNSIELASGKEFPEVKTSFDPSKHDKKQLARKASKAFREISRWATSTHKSIIKLDMQMGNDLRTLRDEAGMQTLSFDDCLLPENVAPDKEDALLEEYKKLARIWQKLHR